MTIRPLFTSLLVVMVTIAWALGWSCLTHTLRASSADLADAGEIASIVGIVGGAALWIGGLLALWVGPRVTMLVGACLYAAASLVPNGPLMGVPRPWLLASIAAGLFVPSLYAVAGTLVMSLKGRRALRTALFLFLTALLVGMSELGEFCSIVVTRLQGSLEIDRIRIAVALCALVTAAGCTLIAISGRKLQPLKHDVSIPRRLTGGLILALIVGSFEFIQERLVQIGIQFDEASLPHDWDRVETSLGPWAIVGCCVLLSLAFLFTGSYGRRMCLHRVIGLGFALMVVVLLMYRSMLLDPNMAADPGGLRPVAVILTGVAFCLIYAPGLALVCSGLPSRLQVFGIVLFLFVERFMSAQASHFPTATATTIVWLAALCLIFCLVLGFFGQWLERRLRSGSLARPPGVAVSRQVAGGSAIRKDLHP